MPLPATILPDTATSFEKVVVALTTIPPAPFVLMVNPTSGLPPAVEMVGLLPDVAPVKVMLFEPLPVNVVALNPPVCTHEPEPLLDVMPVMPLPEPPDAISQLTGELPASLTKRNVIPVLIPRICPVRLFVDAVWS